MKGVKTSLFTWAVVETLVSNPAGGEKTKLFFFWSFRVHTRVQMFQFDVETGGEMCPSHHPALGPVHNPHVHVHSLDCGSESY